VLCRLHTEAFTDLSFKEYFATFDISTLYVSISLQQNIAAHLYTSSYHFALLLGGLQFVVVLEWRQNIYKIEYNIFFTRRATGGASGVLCENQIGSTVKDTINCPTWVLGDEIKSCDCTKGLVFVPSWFRFT
jgi:hypothetical protein